MSLIVHHLNNSRSQRILWLLEEIGAPYEVKYYDRDPVTNLAPPELIAVHPLGKSPVIQDKDRVIIESGAITEYLCERHGRGGTDGHRAAHLRAPGASVHHHQPDRTRQLDACRGHRDRRVQ